MEKKSPAFGNKISPNLSRACLTVFLILTVCHSSANAADNTPAGPIRKAAVAGGFYPGSKADLEKMVDQMLRQADPPEIRAPIRAIMAPHAGYMFSGPVAAFSYKAIAGRDIRTVILMCNSHRNYFDGIAVYGSGSFETPLGLVPVDDAITKKLLAADPRIIDRPEVHEGDHVIEVQLPFLQRTLKDFKIVPILFGNDDPALSKILADALKPLVDDKTLVVASTDMSHYPPYDAASAADHETLQAITTGQVDALDATLTKLASEKVPNAETFLCGVSGVRTVLLLTGALGPTKPVLLKYANAGDSPVGDKNRVVGYGAVAFVDASEKPSGGSLIPVAEAAEGTGTPADEKVVTPGEETELLKLARATVEDFVRNKKVTPYTPASPGLQQKLGAFVTLRENGQLRGCIGQFEASGPLSAVIQQMAVAAASQDPRFRPVGPEELDKLEYEISILSPLRKVPNADGIELGKHGVQISKGFNHGVFLPQVATETGWTKEQFLSELCTQKAGLPADCWKDPGVALDVFTAQVFAEEKK